MSVSVKVVTNGLDALTQATERRRRQRLYAMRAAHLMEPFVPYEFGGLRGSEELNSDYDGGILTWNMPYAARQYYEPMAHTEPGTEDHWDEAMWDKHSGDMERYATDLLMGRE